MNTLIEKKTTWWKEPMVWLIIALPLAAVLASITTVIIAARNADTLVQGDYRKEGLAFHQFSERDQRAAELGLSADLEYESGLVRASVQGRLNPAPDQLALRLFHPTQAEQDLRILLTHTGGGIYSGAMASPRGMDWQAQLEPGDQAWRLTGRWNPTAGESLSLGAGDPGLSTRP